MKKVIKRFLKLAREEKSARQFANTSYAQCGEDLIVKFIFDKIIQISQPTFIDIGANHPFALNNTYLFYLAGSRGVNVDPNPASIQLFSKFRPADVNLEVGISDKPGTLLFYQNASSTLGTFDEEEARINGGTTGVIPIAVITMQEVIEKYCDGSFPDFLSLDVEGFDQRIVESMNFEKSLPKVICVETIRNRGNHKWSKNTAILDLLVNHGYYHHSDTSINSIFVLKSAMKERFV